MSIASEIQALQQDKSDIATALTNKGVTVPDGSGFDSFSTLVDNIDQRKFQASGSTTFLADTALFEIRNLPFRPKFVAVRKNATSYTVTGDTIKYLWYIIKFDAAQISSDRLLVGTVLRLINDEVRQVGFAVTSNNNYYHINQYDDGFSVHCNSGKVDFIWGAGDYITWFAMG